MDLKRSFTLDKAEFLEVNSVQGSSHSWWHQVEWSDERGERSHKKK